MPREDWLVVGIAGATCSGKSTVANELHRLMPSSKIIRQDDYFLDVKDERHVKVPEINHLNFELMSSLNMEGMRDTIANMLTPDVGKVNVEAFMSDLLSNLEESTGSSVVCKTIPNNIPNILIIEGFLVLNDTKLADRCDLKFFITLDRETCWNRRSIRVYEPPDPPGYFELCVWPWYLKHYKEMLEGDIKGIHFMNGTNRSETNINFVLKHVLAALEIDIKINE